MYLRSSQPAVLLLLALFALVQVSCARPLTIARIVDGDTYELSDGRKVRLIGVDTPEKWASDKLDRDAEESGRDRKTIQALGRLATEHASKLVLGRRVELEFEQANRVTGHKDRYGRTLAYVWVLDRAGRRAFMANQRLIENGYANAYTKYPFSRMEAFRRAEREARSAGRGLWADGALRNISSPGPPVKRVQCRARTNAGSRCTRTTTSRSGLCWQHD